MSDESTYMQLYARVTPKERGALMSKAIGSYMNGYDDGFTAGKAVFFHVFDRVLAEEVSDARRQELRRKLLRRFDVVEEEGPEMAEPKAAMTDGR